MYFPVFLYVSELQSYSLKARLNVLSKLASLRRTWTPASITSGPMPSAPMVAMEYLRCVALGDMVENMDRIEWLSRPQRMTLYISFVVQSRATDLLYPLQRRCRHRLCLLVAWVCLVWRCGETKAGDCVYDGSSSILGFQVPRRRKT